MLTKEQFDRLKPFLVRKHARQRIVLYLLATSHTIQEVCGFTYADLKALDLNNELNSYRDEVINMAKYNETYSVNGKVFVYPGGIEFKPQDIYRIIRQATMTALGSSLGIDAFIKLIKKGE